MNVKVKKAAATVLMAGAALVGFASAAAAGSYGSSGNYNHQLDSTVQNATSAGGHSVAVKGTCGNGTTPQVELVQDFWFQPNHFLGRKSFRCDTRSVTDTWSSNDSGDHFLRFYSNSQAVSMNFTWTFPR